MILKDKMMLKRYRISNQSIRIAFLLFVFIGIFPNFYRQMFWDNFMMEKEYSMILSTILNLQIGRIM